MAETNNLGLDMAAEAARPKVARIYLNLACSYLKGRGAPTLTLDCGTYTEFEREVRRLKQECDELLEAARDEFGEKATSGEAVRASATPEAIESPTPAEPRSRKRKLPLRISSSLCVEDEMTRDVKTLRRNDKLSVADELMKIGRFRHVVVVEEDGDTVAGVISHRDIFYGALAWSTGHGETAHQQALDDIPVKNVMRTNVTTVATDTPLAEAARIMLEEKIGSLPVVRNGRLVGILTEGDFLAMLTSAEYNEDRS